MIKNTANGAGGLGFDYLACPIGRSGAKSSPPLRHFFEAVLSLDAKPRRLAPLLVTRLGVIPRI